MNDDVASQNRLRAPGPHHVLETVLELSRAITVDMQVDEIVDGYMERFKKLFPERLFCLRMVASPGELGKVYATGRLLPERRERVEVTREALTRHSVPPPSPASVQVETTDTYRSVFALGGNGFDVPMMDGEEIIGTFAVEYPPGVTPPADDRPLIVQLALQLSSALHNSRLHRESMYLRDYLSKVLDHANAPIMVVGTSGTITFVNRAFLILTAFRREDLMDKDWMSLLPEAERRSLFPVYIGALHGEPSVNVEGRLPRSDGTFARVAVNAASILSRDGDIEGVIYIYRDVTEVRQLEEQVIHAEKLATLGQLAAGVVHELNNPLTSISVYAEYLRNKAAANNSDAGDVEKLRRIVQSADRVLKFTRDLVSYARPSTERPVAADVHEIIDQAVSFCEHLIEETGAVVTKRYGTELPPVYAVKGQLVQVFVNLVTNACHAMPLGAGRLTIDTLHAGEGKLCVRIIDNGRGITEDNLARIFEPFFTTKGEGKGTGLGLSIVKNIIELHRGSITVESEIGAGTVFEVTFACRPEHEG